MTVNQRELVCNIDSKIINKHTSSSVVFQSVYAQSNRILLIIIKISTLIQVIIYRTKPKMGKKPKLANGGRGHR